MMRAEKIVGRPVQVVGFNVSVLMTTSDLSQCHSCYVVQH